MLMLIMLIMVPSYIAAPSTIIMKVKNDYDSEGKTFSVEMNETDTVADLKTKIEKVVKIKPERQKLKYGSRDSVELKNNQKLEELVGKPTVYLSKVKLDEFEIELKYGEEYKNIKVQRTDTVKQLREKANDMFKIPLELLIMCEWGRTSVINDNEKTMDKCYIEENDIICVSWDKFEIQVKFGVGKELSVEVDATDFLSDLEEKIKDLTGIPTEMQKLRFPNGIMLVDHNMMFNGIVKGDSIFASLYAFQINVSYKFEGVFDDEKGCVIVEVNGEDSVKKVEKNIKSMIQKKMCIFLKRKGIKTELRKANDEILDNDNKTMMDYGINENDSINAKFSFDT
ncbi:hypothetical protein niasHS_018071 [Heterodera schachtii]|uniref:Ubiquitin-like domain-containing protein n=1 Tax=Heterodera schachtii TaxID=97005 RepID=A0ABD2HSE8_HETSC